jgi:hypothetical protein
VSGEGGSFLHTSVHVGCDWRVRCNTYDGTPPIFSVDAGSSAVSITIKGHDANPAAVEFARALAREAKKFADEMERMHAAHLVDDGNGRSAGRDAA